jgi:multidrug resistance efflux pump
MDMTTAQANLETAQNAAIAAEQANRAAQQALNQAQADIEAARAAIAAQVVAGTARTVSVIDNASFAERQAGKAAVIAYVKANPGCSEDAAVEAWQAGAMENRPADRQWLLHDPYGLLLEYMANLAAVGAIAEPTWSALAAWLVAAPAEIIMAS